jgi:hypothetical protein
VRRCRGADAEPIPRPGFKSQRWASNRTCASVGRSRLAAIMAKFDLLRALTDVEGSAWNQVMSTAGAAFMRDSKICCWGHIAWESSLARSHLRALRKLALMAWAVDVH